MTIKQTMQTMIVDALKAIGLSESDVFSYVIVDMNREGQFQKGALLLTRDTLYLVQDEKAFSVTARYAVADYERLAVDELLSTCRFYIEKDGERELVTYTTFFSKEDLYRLAGDFEKLKTERENEISDEGASRFCPKCGRRYPDRERQFCPHCMDKGRVIKRMMTFFGKYKTYMLAIIVSMLSLSSLSLLW